MTEQNNKKYYSMNEVSQMTGVHLITVYRRAKRKGVDVITHEGRKLIGEDSFDIIKKVGSPGRPPKKELDKTEDMG